MNKIKFRGKRIDNKEWVYGYLYELPLPSGDACMILTQDNNHLDNHIEPKYHLAFTLWVDLFLVDPDTVGQYTGLTDKNGKEIYEGDIVSHPWKDPIFGDLVETGQFVHSTICFNNGAFVVNYRLQGEYIYLQDFLRLKCLEVVGNIYDNQELLKGGEQ